MHAHSDNTNDNITFELWIDHNNNGGNDNEQGYDRHLTVSE